MPLALHTIKPARKSTRKPKRVGRGNSSGHGTYSGRGLKGQKARSGASGLKRLGMKQILLRTPKLRGFKSLKEKDQIVNLEKISKYYKDNEVVNPETLKEKGLVRDGKKPIKILGKGELTVKGLKFENVKMSKSVEKLVTHNS